MPVERNGLREAGLQFVPRVEPQMAAGLGNIDVGITGLGCQVLLGPRFVDDLRTAGELLNQGYGMSQAMAGSAGDIKSLIARFGAEAAGFERVREVGNVEEVAQLAAIAEDGNGRASERFLHERVQYFIVGARRRVETIGIGDAADGVRDALAPGVDL